MKLAVIYLIAGGASLLPGIALAVNTPSSELSRFWSNKGCYPDSKTIDTCKKYLRSSATAQNRASCAENCGVDRNATSDGPFLDVGLETSSACFCDDSINAPGALVATNDCSTDCTTGTRETCGGTNRRLIHRYNAAPCSSRIVLPSGVFLVGLLG
ncbi:hypothetical protein K505DRAFT_335234 [Melanomma pulvis-pyrius CBS 109.77]|uniref:WSC domain-containing protein n=1 Tax=Melanomma pulvis-pyrius CBS 109.77 TaxID=1314802 RepID=A0A6A6XJL3_9PLEO|nr:hypothetical protein K505DRAFT_335234 [Melanomma pulvis-pyrius CBS 109.77]